MSGRYWPENGKHPWELSESYTLSLEGKLTVKFVEQWGMIVANERGAYESDNTSTTEKVTNPMPPSQVVDRAAKMAKNLVDVLEYEDWILENNNDGDK